MHHGGQLALEAEDGAVLAADLTAQAVHLLAEAGHLKLLLLQHPRYVFLLAELAQLFTERNPGRKSVRT